VARERSTNRKKALQIWLKSGRTKKLVEIADELGISDTLVRKWKFQDKWDEIPAKRPRGAPKGNKNAKGNKGGGAPPRNTNAMKHGLYRKLLPDELQELMKEVENLDPLDMLWQGVELAYAKMLWAQRIMFVRDRDDMTKELKKTKRMSTGKMQIDEKEWNIQFAWDKQAVDIGAFTKISRELRSAIKQFLSAAPENDERRAKLELMQAQVEKVRAEAKAAAGPTDGAPDDGFLDALKGKAAEVWTDGEQDDEKD